MVFTISSGNVEITQVGNRGCIWKQYVLSFIASIPFFTHGVESNALSISTHSGHFTTPDDVPWTTTALILSALLSAPIQCYLIDKFGRKFGVYIVILLQGISCVPLLLTTNELNAIILHVFAGLSSGGLFTVVPIYIREISDDIRGSAVSLMMATASAGYLTRLGMSDEGLMYLMVALVMFQFASVFLFLESPSYLVMVNKIEVAKQNMAKLKCLNEDNTYVKNAINDLKDESDRAISNRKLNIISILKNEIWRDATKIGIVLNTMTVIGGCIIFLDQVKTLMQLKTSVDPDSIMVPISMFGGGVTSTILIKYIERRYYLTFAYSIMVLSMGILAVFTQADLTVTSLRWLPIVALGVLVFSYGMAWGVPIVIMVEIYNFQVRATLIGLIYTYSQILRLAHVHSFKYIEDYVGIYTLLYIFACINLFGAVYTITKVPDIKNKNVRSIERQLKRVPLLKL